MEVFRRRLSLLWVSFITDFRMYVFIISLMLALPNDYCPLPSVDPPVITQHPVNQQIPTGREATLSIKAEGDNLTYQWQNNGSNVCNDNRHIGAATHTLTIRQVNKSDAGHYKCIVMNEVNKDGKVSEEAQLTVCKF